MKILKILSLVLVLSLIGAMAAGCSKKAATTTTTTQEVTVGTGTVTVEATYTGSIDYANYQNLSFAVDGNVGTVNCKVGDLVKQGQVLATLDPTAWAQYIQSLTQAVQTAQSNLTTALSTIAGDQRQVATKQLGVTQSQLGVTQAQLGVQTAQNNLNNIADVKTAQDAIDTIELNISVAQANLLTSGNDQSAAFYINYIKSLNQQLAEAQQNLKDILSGTSTTLSNNVELQVANAQLQVSSAQLQVLQAQDTLINAQAAVDNANQAVTNAQQDVTTAQADVTTAQTNLTNANAASTQITAPFDGAITAVNIQAGVGLSVSSSGAIKAGATAIVIADTSKFVADMMINETDIPNISIGTMATVTATALPNVTLSARVTTISPTATNQSGVVNYAVTATILGVIPQAIPTTTTTTPSGQSGTTTTPSTSGRTATTTATTPSSQSGTTTTPATTGRQRTITTTGTSGQSGTPPTTLPFGSGGQFQQRFQQSSASAMSQIRQGMSLTVNLIEQQAQNVIVVPNTAIKTVSGQSYVELKTSSGTPTQQAVTTGLKDVQNTQILSGLNVGDVIIITKTSSSTTKTTTTQAPGGFGIGGGIIR